MNNTQATFGYIHLGEQSFVPDQCFAEHDVFVFCRSWEARSISAIKRKVGGAHIVNISFEGNPADDVTDPESDDILKRAHSEGRLTKIDLGPSTAISGNAIALQRQLAPILSKRDARVIFDVSSIPKAYTLSIIGWCFGDRLLPALKLFYSEGVYRHVPLNSVDPLADVKLASFTTGPWTLTQIPFLEGNGTIEEGQKLIAFCGGDHDQILSTLAEYEHLSRWAILTSSDPVTPDEVAKRHAQSLEDSAGLSRSQILFANPLSAIDALVQCREVLKRGKSRLPAGTLVLPFSTKPHSIAAAVLSLFDPSVIVLARQPTQYVGQDIIGSGTGVLITVADLSSPFVGPLL